MKAKIKKGDFVRVKLKGTLSIVGDINKAEVMDFDRNRDRQKIADVKFPNGAVIPYWVGDLELIEEGPFREGSKYHVDSKLVKQFPEARIVDDIEILEEPSKRQKFVLAYFPSLRGNYLIPKTELKIHNLYPSK